MNEKYKILAVDDDVFITSIVISKFQKIRLAARALNNPTKNFVNEVLEWNPDFIILDTLMPQISGFEAIQLLKEDPRTKNIPVMFLTNMGRKEDIENGISLGAVDYLVAGQINFELLVDQVLHYLEKPETYKPIYQSFINGNMMVTHKDKPSKDQKITNKKIFEPMKSSFDFELVKTIYVIGYLFAAVIIFIGCYIYAIASYGFLFGVGLGWLPSIIVAAIASIFWPIIVVGLAVLIIAMTLFN